MYPSAAPGRKATRMARMANSTKKEGISTLLIFSMPLETPNIRMAMARTTTITCQGILPNSPVAWLKYTAASVVSMELVREPNRARTTQPTMMA